MSQNPCGLCLSEVYAQSTEHIFPKSVGGSITTTDYCAGCNSHLGSEVDYPLTVDPAILLVRNAFGLGGRSGRVPNPYVDGEIIQYPGPKFTLHQDEQGAIRHKIQPGMVEERNSDGSGSITFYNEELSEEERRHVLERVAERRGLRGALTRRPPAGRIERPTFRFEKRLDAAGVERALVKIAYEATYRLVGQAYLRDPVAETIRKYLTPKRSHLNGQRAREFGLETSELGLFMHRTQAILHGQDIPVLNRVVLRAGRGFLLCDVAVLGTYEHMTITAESDFGLDPLKVYLIQGDLRSGKWFEGMQPNPQPIA